MKKLLFTLLTAALFVFQYNDMKASCHADFTWNETALRTVQFTPVCSGSYNPAYSLWRYGDGSTYTGVGSPTKTYASTGTYGVSLILRDSSGHNCDSVYHIVHVDSCFGAFRVAYQCGDSVLLEVVHGMTTVANIFWGDGTNTYTGMGAAWNTGAFGHRYLSGGLKEISLRIPMFFGACMGVSDTFTSRIEIILPPRPTFSTVLTGDSVTCMHTGGGLRALFGSANYGMSWWDFGDGIHPHIGEIYPDTVSGHRYLAPGVYYIKHWVTNLATAGPWCASDTLRDTVEIGSCFASFTASLPSSYVSASLPVFDVLTNHSSYSTTSSNYWTLDGVGMGMTTGSSSLYTMSIGTYGRHEICLILYDPARSCYDTACTIIEVSAPHACTAGYTVALGTGGLAAFTNTSTGSYYYWNFGDGSISTATNPTHTYLTNDTFHVCLYVSNVSSSCCYCDTFCHDIIITSIPHCTAYFYDSLMSGYTYYFHNYSYGAEDFLWSFGDGTFSHERNPDHAYAGTGTYNVCLYIRADTTSPWCDTFCRTITITGSCHASYTVNIHCNTMEFRNASTGGFTYGWDFGDGSPISHDVNPTHVYSDTGIHVVYVTLYVYNASGFICDSFSHPLTYYTFDTLSGFVWNDANGNGILDAGESVRSGQEVAIYDASGTSLLGVTYTNSAGGYQFLQRAGTYRIVLGALSTGHYQSYPASPSYYEAHSTGTCSSTREMRFGVEDSSRFMMYICGYVYEDNNNNGVKDAGESGISGEVVNIDSFTVITNSVGFYYVVVPVASYSISYFISPAYAGYVNTSPTILNIVPVPGVLGYTNNNFGINDTVEIRNLCAELIPLNGLNAYTRTIYMVRVWNHGTVPMNGQAVMNYDPAFTYDYTSPTSVHDAVAHTITWSFTAIPAHSYRSYYAYFLPVSAPIGTTVFNSCEAISSSGAEIEYDCNLDTMHQVVGVSYDPNDKLVTPVGLGATGQINPNTELAYTIRFQNTGTASAVNVIVKDDLDPDLDVETFELIAASHDVRTQLSGRSVTFYFDDIMLPDSTSNPEGSKGYIKYKIHTNPALPEGSTINNTADIYFDSNPAIRTNTTLNTIAYKLLIDQLEANIHFQAYPNPFENTINFTMDGMQNGKATIVLFDVLGNKVLQKEFTATNTFTKIQLQTDQLSNAVYMYQLMQNGKVLSEGKLIRH